MDIIKVTLVLLFTALIALAIEIGGRDGAILALASGLFVGFFVSYTR